MDAASVLVVLEDEDFVRVFDATVATFFVVLTLFFFGMELMGCTSFLAESGAVQSLALHRRAARE